jgi:hypothetical protein
MDDSETDRDPALAGSEAGVDSSTSQGEERQAWQEPGSPVTRRSLQQRFEESSIGVWVISAIVVVILGVQVIWSAPDSPIRQGLMNIVEPANALDINVRWAMFARNLNRRVEDFEVQVTMADGSTRTWKRVPRSPLEKIVLPDRWELMTYQATRQQDGRKDFARWVVKEVTGPSDRPVNVVMMYHFRVLPPPGEPSTGQTGTKVLYEETLTGRP